jgi:glycosidase
MGPSGRLNKPVSVLAHLDSHRCLIGRRSAFRVPDPEFLSPIWVGMERFSVFEFWIRRGVRMLRFDIRHTKGLPFWKWCLSTMRANCPGALPLAQAFTRPHVTYALAKRGFTQPYMYFTQRNSKFELQTCPAT